MGFDAQHELASPSGAGISVNWREAEGTARAIVQISHGLGEHSGYYAGFADLLASRDFHVYAHDHRGHGQTRATDTLPGHFGGGAAAQKVLTDMSAVRDFVGLRHPGLPVIFFGRAAGGLIALDFALHHPDRVSAFAWEYPPPLRFGYRQRVMLAWERLRLGSDVPSRAMTGDAPASVGTWRAIVAMQDRLAGRRTIEAAARRMPILILGGREKPPASGRDDDMLAGRLRKTGFANVTLRRIVETGPGEDGVAAFGDWAQTMLD